MSTGKIKVSLLSPGSDVSALKLRGWLHSQAESINNNAGENDHVLIRLFLCERVRFGFTEKKLDTLLQGISDKYSRIYRVELFIVKQPLNQQEMQEEAKIANEDISDMLKMLNAADNPDTKNWPIQYFGYTTESSPSSDPFSLEEEGLICMVSNITELNQESINRQTGKKFNLGQWFVSEGAHENTIVHGAFDDMETGFNFAKEHCKAIRFKSFDA